MPLPAPNLDDLRFQRDLVDEARRRIIHYCPEWTDYNLSDPGITLIELFAWMTETMIYRLNQVPEKNYIKFMELLGIQLQPASSARAELTFRLSTPFPINPEDETVAVVPAGTEVATQQTEEEAEVTFTTDDKLTIRPPRLVQLRREGEFHKNYLPRLGIEIFYAFNERRPQIGDTFYLGFREDEDISGHILRLTFQCERTQAVGVKREDPPLVWECSVGNGLWEEVQPSLRQDERDTTGGLNNPEGSLVLYLPLSMKPDQVNGRNGYWLRCRVEQRRPDQGMYTESPRVVNVRAYSLGATTRATHAVIVRSEILGRSNGEPGQIFGLRNTPVLALREAGETIEVEEKRQGDLVFTPWERVPDFSNSDRYDRHFTLDTATGEICFGPAIRQSDGTVRQYGRIPPAGYAIRFSQYRHGGGVTGNVPVGKINVLKSAIPYIDQVTNLRRAAGGRDQETLEEAKFRAQRELRAQLRAVTPEDYEDLAKKASRSVGRVKCNIPQGSQGRLPPGIVEILIVPSVTDSLRSGDLSKLHVDEILTRMVSDYLDNYRLLTTTLQIKAPRYLGIKVEAEIVTLEYSQPELVRARVLESLRNFISPLALNETPEQPDELMGTAWEGWPFGRSLYVAEIFSLIQRVPGVKHVLDVKLNQRAVTPATISLSNGDGAGQGQEALTVVNQKVIHIPQDTLLCSLEHEIKLVELGADHDQG
jgi:predicted phage baseplate assembly protein